MHELTVTYRSPSSLTFNPHNARTHDPRQIGQIVDSIRAFGFTNPILVDEQNKLIAGHGRLAAALRMGLEKVPVIALEHLNTDQKRVLMLADNKIALNAGWDENADACVEEWTTLVEDFFGHALDANCLVHSLEPLRTVRELEVRRLTADRQVKAMEKDQSDFALEISKLCAKAEFDTTLPPLEAFKFF